MDERARQAYLQSQVMNASPQKLQWMLIDGALRYATQAEAAWNAGDTEQASQSLDRARQIVAQILSAIQVEVDDVARQVMGLYVWLFRTLAEAQLLRDSERLAEVIQILRMERETWQQVCEQMSGSNTEASPTTAPPPLTFEGGSAVESQGISFEA